ncbi:MAG: hypothetical protein HUU20_12380 [Pirellulales bacterium]|nr:hypothetical protein [Pirellulales bacterium]
MGDPFDPYREALVVEHSTVWPGEFSHLDPQIRQRIEAALHASPAEAKELAYLRLPTGFHRQITVTAEDVERLK